jgi:hypothetical protein
MNDYQTSLGNNREAYLNGDVKAGEKYIYDNQKIDAEYICNKFYTTDVRAISIIKKNKSGYGWIND